MKSSFRICSRALHLCERRGGVLEFSGDRCACAREIELEIYGDLGTLHLRFYLRYRAGRSDWRSRLHVLDLTPETGGGWHVEEDFIAAVKSKGRVRPRPNFEEGVRYMRVVQAVADSRARNQWVEVKI